MLRIEGKRAIFFDATDTLFHVRGSVGEIYSRIALRYGVRAEPKEVQKSFEQAFRRMPPMAFPGLSGADLLDAEKKWWEEVVRGVFAGRMPGSTLEAYFSEVFEAFRGPDSWELLPHSRSGLERLKARGYLLGVISNFDSRLLDVLESLGIRALMECVIISSRAGAAKPDAKIFHQALAAVRVGASEALHVGDSLEEDVYGAQRAGLQAILLDPPGRYCDRYGVARVRDLSELCSVFDV